LISFSKNSLLITFIHHFAGKAKELNFSSPSIFLLVDIFLMEIVSDILTCFGTVKGPNLLKVVIVNTLVYAIIPVPIPNAANPIVFLVPGQ
jgi:hypothetical protein